MIERANADDIPAITALWNDVIRDTTITFTTDPKTEVGIAALIDRQPVLVARHQGRCAGFGTFGPFRSGPGYAACLEHAIYLDAAARGTGLGRALMTGIETAARGAGGHGLVAGISGENENGIAFHATMGFAHAGRIPDAGRKFGRWIDLVLMHKPL